MRWLGRLICFFRNHDWGEPDFFHDYKVRSRICHRCSDMEWVRKPVPLRRVV